LGRVQHQSPERYSRGHKSGDAVDVDRAVNAAYDAFPAWSATSPIHLEIATRIRKRRLDYAMTDPSNSVKTISTPAI